MQEIQVDQDRITELIGQLSHAERRVLLVTLDRALSADASERQSLLAGIGQEIFPQDQGETEDRR